MVPVRITTISRDVPSSRLYSSTAVCIGTNWSTSPWICIVGRPIERIFASCASISSSAVPCSATPKRSSIPRTPAAPLSMTTPWKPSGAFAATSRAGDAPMLRPIT